MAVRTRFNEGTESADNKVTKLEGGVRYVRMDEYYKHELPFRGLLSVLTRARVANIRRNEGDVK